MFSISEDLICGQRYDGKIFIKCIILENYFKMIFFLFRAGLVISNQPRELSNQRVESVTNDFRDSLTCRWLLRVCLICANAYIANLIKLCANAILRT